MTIERTIGSIMEAASWSQRIAQIRLVPQRHGTEEHAAIYAAVARELYMPHLTADFAFIHESPFYEPEVFLQAYQHADRLTAGFTRVAEADLAAALTQHPETLLVFRTMLGLTKSEFAHASTLAAAPLQLTPLSPPQVEAMERAGAAPADGGAERTIAARAVRLAQTAARTVGQIMSGDLFGPPPPGLRSKQDKPDTAQGWDSVRRFAQQGVPFWIFLHQRHYGGAFRQVLDATSAKRGDLIEDAVETLFSENGVAFVRTGSRNQAEIARRFELHVTPAPDFVVFDPSDDSLKAMLECKGANDGGTARDKALRFNRLKEESVRLGGVPLIAVLGGIGWTRINDALGPVVRDTDGRVFTLSTLASMLEVQPFPGLVRRRAPDAPTLPAATPA